MIFYTRIELSIDKPHLPNDPPGASTVRRYAISVRWTQLGTEESSLQTPEKWSSKGASQSFFARLVPSMGTGQKGEARVQVYVVA